MKDWNHSLAITMLLESFRVRMRNGVLFAAALWVLLGCEFLFAQSRANQSAELSRSAQDSLRSDAEKNAFQWISPESLSSSLPAFAAISVLSLAPALALMTTSFVRLSVVLYLLRQAFGAQQLLPNQVLSSLAIVLTILIMRPVWSVVYSEAIQPYAAEEISGTEAWERGTEPLNVFMSRQIEKSGNSEDVWLFLEYLPQDKQPESYREVPFEALMPAFLLSELKTAFLIGFQIYLPFLIIDLVVATILSSMGMIMLPPMFVSVPFKLLLFVLVDGWNLVIGALIKSFSGFG